MKNGKFALIAAVLSLYAFGDGRVTETSWHGAYDSGDYSDEGFVVKKTDSFDKKTYYWCCKNCGNGIEVIGFDVSENWDGSYVPCVYTGTWDDWPSSSLYVGYTYLHSGIIPSEVNDKPLVRIGLYAFVDCGFNSFDIPSTVTKIESHAFQNCKKLLGLDLPSGLTEIGKEAFSGCVDLFDINIPASVTKIGANSFRGCEKLRSNGLIVIDGCLVDAGDVSGAFIVPTGVRLVADAVFEGCSGLESATIPATVTSVGRRAFGDCQGLLAIDFEGAPPTGVVDAAINQTAVVRYNSQYANDWLPVIAQCGWSNASPYTPETPTGPVERKPDGGPYTETVDGIDWSFRVMGGCAEIRSGKSEKPAIPSAVAGEIMIPSFLGGCPVTVIGEYAFRGCGNLTSVSVPEGVTTIGNYAFFNCGLLATLKLPTTVKSIGEYAFSYCRAMADFAMPKGVASIGKSAFLECNSLLELELPSSLMSLGEGAFSNCSGLTMVSLPRKLEEITWSLFHGCESLTSVSIPEGVESIGGLAFRGCVGLKEIVLPSSVKSIDKEAFADCSGLVSFVISSNATSIGQSAFAGCVGLTSFEIPDSVISVGAGAFSGCVGLSEVQMSKELTSISDLLFFGCVALRSITLYDKIKSIGDRAFYQCGELTNLILPSSVTSIDRWAFVGCGKLEVLTIRGDVPSFGYQVFSDSYINSNALKRVYVKEGCVLKAAEQLEKAGVDTESIMISEICQDGDYNETIDGVTWSFSVVGGEATVTSAEPIKNELSIPAVLGGCSVKCVGDLAFWYKGELKSIVIPEGVTRIGEGAFLKSGLVSVMIPDSVTTISARAFRWCDNLTEIRLPRNMTQIGEQTFDGCKGLTSLEIPSGVLDIGPHAFSSCRSLYSVLISSGVTNIGAAAFASCGALKSMLIPSSVRSIGDEAFEFSGLASVTLPEGIVKIGKEVFHGCDNLTTVALPSSVTSIGESAFENCNKLKSITIPSNVSEIGASAFWYCSNLLSVEMQEGVLSIGSGAFYGCDNLMSVSVPSTVESISENAFEGCNKIVVVFVKEDPQECVRACFGDGVWYQKLGAPIKYEWKYFRVGIGCVSISGVEPAFGDVEIPDCLEGLTVESIGSFAFKNCAGIRSVRIPSTVATIGDGAFEGCVGLSSIVIPSCVSSIGADVFRNCSGLSEITVDGENSEYCSVDGILYNNAQTELIRCPMNKRGSLNIVPKIENVNEGAFEGCALTSITLPSCVKNIGASAFWGCGDMTTIQLPSGLQSVGQSAFGYCWSLKLVRVIPGGDLNELKFLLSGGGMDVSNVTFEYVEDLIPELAPDADSAAVHEALEGSTDGQLAKNITDVNAYGLYREWALKIGAADVKASPFAWVSFATDSAALLAKMPTDDDLKVEEFKPSAAAGSFDFTVSVKDVKIGDRASVDNLKKLFGLEGAESLDTAAFSSENVSLDFKEPQDGKLKFSATPAVDNAKSFFMKAKVK